MQPLPGIHPDDAVRFGYDAVLPNLILPIDGAALPYSDGDRVEDRLLEVGAGCGALTGFIAEQAATVLALEGAPRRARITAARHRARGNVTVLACDLGTFRADAPFDAVVVVGVLEYAPRFGAGGREAPLTVLNQLRALLAPGGTLLLAIENQLGLSYIGGMPEDHAGAPWVGVEDRYGEAGFRTYGRHALARLWSAWIASPPTSSGRRAASWRSIGSGAATIRHRSDTSCSAAWWTRWSA